MQKVCFVKDELLSSVMDIFLYQSTYFFSGGILSKIHTSTSEKINVAEKNTGIKQYPSKASGVM